MDVKKTSLSVLAALSLVTSACSDSTPAAGPLDAMSETVGRVDAAAPAPSPDARTAAGDGAIDAAADTAADAAGPGEGDAAGPADAPPALPPAPGRGTLVVLAGGDMDADGIPASQARLAEPFGAVTNPRTGEIYIAEYGRGRVRRIDAQGNIHTVMGPGASGPAGAVRLDRPHDLLFRPGTRSLFVADTFGNRVLRFDADSGAIEPFAGAGTRLIPGLRGAYCLAFDRAGKRLYLTNTGGGRIEIIDLTSLAVTGVATPSPRVVTVDSQGNLYVVQNGGNVIKRIDLAGAVTNLPGAVDAPKRISVDADDNILIADTESDRLRKYVPGMGIVLLAEGLNRPHGVFEDASRRLLIADSGNNRVVRLEP